LTPSEPLGEIVAASRDGRRTDQLAEEDHRGDVSAPITRAIGAGGWHEISEVTATVRPGGVLEKQPLQPTTDDAGVGAGYPS
jgi:hypothetical protein